MLPIDLLTNHWDSALAGAAQSPVTPPRQHRLL
jgi:hypothetical protein